MASVGRARAGTVISRSQRHSRIRPMLTPKQSSPLSDSGQRLRDPMNYRAADIDGVRGIVGVSSDFVMGCRGLVAVIHPGRKRATGRTTGGKCATRCFPRREVIQLRRTDGRKPRSVNAARIVPLAGSVVLLVTLYLISNVYSAHIFRFTVTGPSMCSTMPSFWGTGAGGTWVPGRTGRVRGVGGAALSCECAIGLAIPQNRHQSVTAFRETYSGVRNSCDLMTRPPLNFQISTVLASGKTIYCHRSL